MAVSACPGIAFVWVAAVGSRELAWQLGGKKYFFAEMTNAICRLSVKLIESGCDADSAVCWSKQLLLHRESETSEIEKVLGPSLSGELLAATASFCRLNAERHLDFVQKFMPAVVVLAVGGIFSLVYAVCVYLPIVSMFEGVGTS